MATRTSEQLDALVDEVLSTSLRQFAADTDAATLDKLYAWLGEHEHDEDLFAAVIQNFPRLGEVIVREMERVSTATSVS
jgi:hypothetical protein